MVSVDSNPTDAAASSADMLRDELGVAIGHLGRSDSSAKRARLPVTFTNKTGVTAEFTVAVAAFGHGGHQIDSDTVHVVLAARCSEEQDMFTVSPLALLTDASFRVIAARKFSRWHG